MKTANDVMTWSGAATKSLGATATSDPFPVKNMTLACVAMTATGGGSPTGTLKLQASVDEGHDPGTGLDDVSGLSTWVDIDDASQAITTDGTVMINLTDIGYRWIRAVWTRTSGTGTLAVRVNAKAGA